MLFRVHGDWVPLKVSLFEVEPQPAHFASGYAGGDHVGGWSGSWDKQFNSTGILPLDCDSDRPTVLDKWHMLAHPPYGRSALVVAKTIRGDR